jgi:hypothetical protein
MTLQMDHVIRTGPRDSIGYVINRIAARCGSQRMKNVVFNCHGEPAYLYTGRGIGMNQVPLFIRLRGKVEKIWFYACSVAGQPQGLTFCAEVAKQARCYVLASPDDQSESDEEEKFGLPFNSLDTFEGKLISFDPAGQVNWTRTYPNTGWPNP